MRKPLLLAAVAFSFWCLVPAPPTLAAPAGRSGESMHRLGLGVNYWKTIDDLDERDVDENGFSYLVSYQYAPVWYFKLEAGLEVFPDLAGSPQAVLAPEIFATVGGPVYAGVGIGLYYDDGDWGEAPFYMLRAGVDFPFLPRLFLDISANYRFNDWNTLRGSDLDTDTIRLGAMLRLVL